MVKYIREECPHLEFSGLMTIGSVIASQLAEEEQRNPDFEVFLSRRVAECLIVRL